MKRTQSAGGVVVNSKRGILVVNQEGTSWSLPKGHIKKGENKVSAAKREIYEEAGISDLKFIKSLGSYKRFKDGTDCSELKTIFMFLFKTNQNILKPIDSHNPEAVWVPKNKAASLLTFEKDKEFFLSIKKKI